jgi:hypothetical protein
VRWRFFAGGAGGGGGEVHGSSGRGVCGGMSSLGADVPAMAGRTSCCSRRCHLTPLLIVPRRMTKPSGTGVGPTV